MEDKHLYLIDATAFCYRAFHAISGLATTFGQPTNAIYGFVNMLNKILRDNQPRYLGVCFDVSRDTFRQKKYAAYKIQRPPMPEGLSGQLPLIKEIVAAYGITILEKPGFEADDIIATLAKNAKTKGMRTTIISQDKDMLQLVDESTQVYSPHKDSGTLYDRQKVTERFGTEPQQITDIIALMGDTVDNIPGAKGIGEKTAVKLVQKFGTVENLLENWQDLKPERLKEIVQANRENIKLSKELAILDDQVEIDLELEKIQVIPADYAKLYKLFKHLEFKTLLKGLPIEEKEDPLLEVSRINEEQLKDLVNKESEIFLYALSPQELYLTCAGKVFQLEKLGKQAKAILEDQQVKKTGYELKQLRLVLQNEGIRLDGFYFDVKIAAHLVNPSAASYALTDLIWNYLEQRASENISPARAVDFITRLKQKLEEELRSRSLWTLFTEIEMPLAGVLADMETAGIKLDLEFLKQLSRDLDGRLEKLIRQIYTLSGCEFNINSPKQLREVLFEKLKLPVGKKNKTGASTDEGVLRKLARDHKLPELLLEYRQLMKLKTTYVDALPELVDKKTGRIHTCFNQTATETGRLSSTNPNLQNIPIKTEIGSSIRKAVVVSQEKNYLLSFDYSQIELRILAHISGDQNLVSAFRQDKDIHRITASLINGIAESDVTEAMREVAKRINFGIVYGLSGFGLARDLDIGMDQAQNFIDAYFLRYPGVQDYIQKEIKEAQENGFITTILGRRRYLPEIKNKNMGIRQMAERQAVNTPIQGSASDLIKLAMIHIQQEFKNRRFKSAMLIQIHDELVFEVTPDELDDAVALIKDKMENVLKLDVPVRVSIKKGKNWLEMEEVK